MIRKEFIFKRKLQFWLKYLLLGASAALLVSFPLISASQLHAFASTPANQLLTSAQSLTAQGHEQLGLGRAEEALKIWEKAAELYTQLGDTEGVTGSKINQSLALQRLGLYRRACQNLLAPLQLDYQDYLICKQSIEIEESPQKQLELLQAALKQQRDSQVRALGLRVLGDVLRSLGNLDSSEIILSESSQMSQRLYPSADISNELLSLCNTKRALYASKQEIYQRTELTTDRDEAIKIAEESLGCYEKITQNNQSVTLKTVQTQAQLNHLSLLIELHHNFQKDSYKKSLDIQAKTLQIQLQINEILGELIQNPQLFSNLSPIETIDAHLNLSISLAKLNQTEKITIAIQYATTALQQAKSLKNQRAEAYAYGILGSLYEQNSEIASAEHYTEEALRLAQSIQAWDIAYQWQYQLGKIYEKREKIKEALAAYKGAVDTLEQVRQDLLSVNPDLQFSFRDDVKPIYEDFINLLMQENPTQAQLEQVTDVFGKLQLAELQNFLQCGSLKFLSLNEVKNLPAAFIYTIVLPRHNRVEVIVSLPQSSESPQYRHYSIPWHEVSRQVTSLRDALQSQTYKPANLEREILPPSRKLYELLIAPAESYLPEKGTLVFVQDRELQNIPMAVLQNQEQHYLIEKYSIAVSLGVLTREPKFSPWKQLRALVTGVSYSESFRNFYPPFQKLANIPEELNLVQENTVASHKLLNGDFTLARFQNQVETSPFPVIHIATHGIFSSEPEKTMILASDKPIKVWQLDRLLRSRNQSSRDTIELLVLSACQTAKGDKRASLGIAGIAVQAGARSTLASLWNVSDRSTALFMGEFYRALKAGATKAEALQKVQLAFLKNPDNKEEYKSYTHPYYWAAFILAGNWL
ncbi:MAG: CHAT domain-containing protein [Actinomycetota bacterium]